jgi:hypothetical protein
VNNLRLTKPQIALLESVAAGTVKRNKSYTYIEDYDYSTHRVVTARMRKLAVAGLVYLDDKKDWQLTDAGSAVLDGYPPRKGQRYWWRGVTYVITRVSPSGEWADTRVLGEGGWTMRQPLPLPAGSILIRDGAS